MYNICSKLSNAYSALGQKISASLVAPSRTQGQVALFLFGVGLLTLGLQANAGAVGSATNLGLYNDTRITEAVNRIFGYLEGSFGALVMVAAGLGAIISSAFGQYKAALGLLVVAVGAFILRSLVSTFFNDNRIA